MSFTTPMKIILAMLVIAVIAISFWLLDWQHKHNELNTVKQQKAELQEKLEKNRDLVKALPVLTREKADLEEQLRQVVQTDLVAEKPELFVANYIKQIERVMLEERVRMSDPTFDILNIQPGALTSSSPGGTAPEEAAEGADATPDALKSFPTRVFNMSMRGKYATLIDFLYQLGALKLERLVTIDKIALSPADKTSVGSPTLTITIPITAYMRQGG
jgi:Tfp pilus assembly protein PilO